MKIILSEISKTYDRAVLDGINHTFETGKLYVIKGVSGCGKSTLLNIIGGTLREFDGEIVCDGGEYTCSYIFQKSLLSSSLSVRDNLKLILDDEKMIGEVSEKVGISGLLDRYPTHLSGGERQRASIARALLSCSDVLLADEPTASLDEDNSNKIASLLKKISGNKIVIVATHEDCFDPLADEIIYLDYGKTAEVVCRDTGGSIPAQTQEKKAGSGKTLSAFMYALRRKWKDLLKKCVPLALTFMLIFCAATLSDNFRSEFEKYSARDQVTDLFWVNPEQIDELRALVPGIRVYENYTCEENGIICLPLFDKKDSVFALSDMIARGKFPENDSEVLVTAAYSIKFPKTKIGDTVSWKNKNYTVSGILYSAEPQSDEPRNKLFVSHYRLSPYYRETLTSAAILMPYGEISSVNPVTDSGSIAASYPDLFDHKDVLKTIREFRGGDAVNSFEVSLNDLSQTVRIISVLLIAVFLVCFIIVCVFLRTNIEIELYSRRKEIGFLQIFGVGKKWIKKALFYEYLIKFTSSVVIGFAAYMLCSAVYSLAVSRFVIIHAVSAAVIICGTGIIYLLTVIIAVGKYMKTSTVELIS